MKTKPLSFAGIGPIFLLPRGAALLDVAPPVGPIVALSAGVLAVIGCGVVVVVVVSILVIRSIRKNRGPKNPA
jgi:hypothetical protein